MEPNDTPLEVRTLRFAVTKRTFPVAHIADGIYVNQAGGLFRELGNGRQQRSRCNARDETDPDRKYVIFLTPVAFAADYPHLEPRRKLAMGYLERRVREKR